jgi:chitin synthase
MNLDSKPDSVSIENLELDDARLEVRRKVKNGTKNVKRISSTRNLWVCCTWSLTWCFPSFLLFYVGRMKLPAVQMAWREKVALNLIILIGSALLLIFIIGIPLLLCPNRRIMSQYEIEERTTLNRPLISMYGMYYSIPDILKSHVFEQQFLNEHAFKSTVLGRDVSAMFVKTDFWSQLCPGLQIPPSGWDNIKREIPEDVMTVWMIHNEKDKSGRSKNYLDMIRKMQRGFIARDNSWIASFFQQDPLNHFLLIAYDRVYDVSTYMNQVQRVDFLGKNIRDIIIAHGQTGRDVTTFLEQVKKVEGFQQWQRYMTCIDNMFLAGLVDYRQSAQCVTADYIVLSASAAMMLIIGFKFFAALQFHSDSNPEFQDRFVICCVPCYTEGFDSLRVTIDSLALTTYESHRKLMFIICDGMVKGVGNDKNTPDIVLEILGNQSTLPPVRSYLALGEGMKQLNMARVYSGLYVLNGQSVPYIVVAKLGDISENNKPGNRGKRDSQLVLMQYLSRVHLQKDMSPLDLEIHYHFIYKLGMDPRNYEFLLWVDSDTEIFPDSLSRYVSYMTTDVSTAGICGETLLRNEGDSWVTMIQVSLSNKVYEYFIQHHLAKSFESLFGTVTCLPGCFSMYRIWNSEMSPILVSPKIIQDYGVNEVNTLHLKNLLSLGEDRYLTTLMLKHFPQMKLRFTPDAKAKTSAPDKWSVLMSQRRRWINSTVHNLTELLGLGDMCGCCLVSMRFVIFMDLFGTVMSPAGFVYVIWLIVTLVLDDTSTFPLISMVMLSCVYGLQVIIFVLKREWQHLGWMIIYILAMPMYSFLLPIYSFWHFDDFTWGQTRNVSLDDFDHSAHKSEEVFDQEMIPIKSWEDYMNQDLLWRQTFESNTN